MKLAVSFCKEKKFGEASLVLKRFLKRNNNPELLQHVQVLKNQEIYVTLGTCLMSEARYEESVRNYQTLVNACETQITRYDAVIAEKKQELEQWERGRETEEEREKLQNMVEMVGEAKKTLRMSFSTYSHDLGISLANIGDTMGAQSAFNKAITLLQQHEERHDELLGVYTSSLAMLYENIGNYKHASELHSKTLRLIRTLDRFDHPHAATMFHPAHFLKSLSEEQLQMQRQVEKDHPNWRYELANPASHEDIVREVVSKEKIAKIISGELPSPFDIEKDSTTLENEIDADLSTSSYEAEGSSEDNHSFDSQSPSAELAPYSPIANPNMTVRELTDRVEKFMASPEFFDEVQEQAKEDSATVNYILKLHKEKLGPKNILLVPHLLQLATLQRQAGNFENSKNHISEALTIIKEAKGGVNNTMYATALMNKAIHHHAGNELLEAEIAAKEALYIKDDLLGPDHLHVGLIHYDLAVILGKRSLFKESIFHLTASRDIFRKQLFEDHPFFLTVNGALLHAHSLIAREEIMNTQSKLKSFQE